MTQAFDPAQHFGQLAQQLDTEERAGFHAALTGAAPAEGKLAEIKQQVDQLPPEARQQVVGAFALPEPGGPDGPPPQGTQGPGFGNFTNAQPDPSGATAFQTRDGRSLLFSGPAAQEAQQMIDRSRQFAPPAVAGLSGGQEATRAAAFGGASPLASDAQSGVGASAPADAGVPPMLAREAPAEAGPQRKILPGGFIEEGGVIFKEERVAPQKGGVVPQSVTKQTRGGFERSPEFEEALKEGAEGQIQTAESLRDVALRGAEKRKELVDAQFQERTAEQQRAQELAEAQQQEVQAAQQKWESAHNEYLQTKDVDPNRIFRGGSGTLRAIAMALAAGAGAFASTLGGGPNSALQVVNKTIDDDIRAQREEIALKKDKAQGLLADLQRKGLSQQQSETLARSIMRERTALELQAITAEQDLGEVAPTFNQMVNDIRMQNAKDQEAYLRASEGDATTTVASRVQQASAGGVRRRIATLDETGKLKKLMEQSGAKENPTPLAPLQRVNKLEQSLETGVRLLENLDAADLTFPDIDDPTKELVVNPFGDFRQIQQAIDRDTELMIEAAAQANNMQLTESNRGPLQHTVVGDGTATARKNNAQFYVEESAKQWVNTLGALPPEERQRRIDGLSPKVRQVVKNVMRKHHQDTGREQSE